MHSVLFREHVNRVVVVHQALHHRRQANEVEFTCVPLYVR